MDQQPKDRSSPPGSPEMAPKPGLDVQNYVSPVVEDVDGVADVEDETDSWPEIEDENDHDELDTPPRIPPTLIHNDISHLTKHLHDQPGALISMFNWAHYMKSKLGSAAQSVIAHVTDIKDAMKSAVDRLRNVLGHNFENVPHIIKKSAEEAFAWVKDNPKKTALIVVCAVGVAVPVVFATPALAAAGFGAGGVTAGSLAASIQASIGGSVAAGSAFAVLTSAGAGGYGLATVCGAIQVVSGIGLFTTAASAFKKSRAIKDKDE
ncbi:hypothetical protein BLS_002726 [Venturia inaequalis]|uniref:Uncharacterized protein n=1 Tax=Venturia inaequalis TaxID=5025 RepID=A0A8H3UTG5_VENIN|nr:hypothetical protein BLS_002726 [Venturia inaequalis]KAE9979822.1 hypothetical protein EG328_000670 [Venturia inaequalis]RDI89567.1 hypothetical protein Vi05172_g380 [Venturia inaequalis]